LAESVFTVGHSTRPIDVFIDLLQSHALTPWALVEGTCVTYPALPLGAGAVK
jgi:hypothetical protein